MNKTVLCLFIPIFLSSCALPVKQIRLEQSLTPRTGSSFTLAYDKSCSYGTGYSRTLRSGTHWKIVGDIEQGSVYSSNDQVLTVEGFNVHEAYIVVKDSYLEGFYLPVEKTFTPASAKLFLPVKSE